MKFWQRQFLLSVSLFCFGVVVFLHSRTPDVSEWRGAGARPPRAGSRGAWAPRPEGEASSPKNRPPGDPPLLKRNVDVQKGAAEKGQDEGVPPRVPAPGLVFVNLSSGSDCPHLRRPENVAETQQFQKVDGAARALEFSAFLDVEQRLVRVVGLSVPSSLPVVCLLWYRPHPRQGGGKELRVVRGRFSILPEHHGRRYKAHYIECPLPEDEAPAPPYAVSLTSKDCRQPGDGLQLPQQPTNVLPVLGPPPASSSSSSSSSSPVRNFTVCVTALNFRYSRAYELVEMIELNRLLGAQLFTFYVHSVGDNVRQVLRWYQARGLVQLVAWGLPMEVDHWPPAKKQPEVHYFAQIASHNDCLNRHRGYSRYLVYQDLDEFIIPKQTTTWAQLLASLKDHSSGYLFKCIFFRKDWPPNSENFTGRALADRYRSVVLSADKREPAALPFSSRAKYMVDPARVQAVGIHNVWKFRGGGAGELSKVGERDALLHHYRGWENPGDAARAVRDADAYRFKGPLLRALRERWAQLPPVPLDVPLAQYGQV